MISLCNTLRSEERNVLTKKESILSKIKREVCSGNLSRRIRRWYIEGATGITAIDSQEAFQQYREEIINLIKETKKASVSREDKRQYKFQ